MSIPQKKYNHNPIGILAGKGELPWLAAKNIINANEKLKILSLEPTNIPQAFLNLTHRASLTKLYSSVIYSINAAKIKRVIILGDISRETMYRDGIDLRLALTFLRKDTFTDDDFFLFCKKNIEKQGIQILPQTLFLQNLFLEEGRYGPKLNAHQIQDVKFGLQHSQIISQINIGLTTIVADRKILAVQVAEDSHSCIKRGGTAYKNNKIGPVVCKITARNHDMLYNVPTVSIETLKVMHKSKCRVLVLDSLRTFVIDIDSFVKKAEEYSITLFVINNSHRRKKYIEYINSKTIS